MKTKIIIAIICVVSIIAVLLPVFAADTPTPTNTGDPITITKVRTQIENKPGEYKIDLTVKAADSSSVTTTYTDVMLVIDTTSSMGDSGLKALKSAAQNFIDTLLSDEESIARVCVIKYAALDDKNPKDSTQYLEGRTKVLNTYCTSGSNFYTHATWQSAKNSGKDILEEIPTSQADAGFSTNIMLGLKMAEEILSSDECKGNKPCVVLMTDGAPNKALKLTKNVTQTVYWTPETGYDNNNYAGIYSAGQSQYNGSGGDDAAYYSSSSGIPNEDVAKYIASFDATKSNLTFRDTTTHGNEAGFFTVGDSATLKWARLNSSGGVASTTSKSGQTAMGVCQATYYEGCVLKSMGEVYVVAASVKQDQTKNLLKKMSTNGDTHYFEVDKSQGLIDKFVEIASKIKKVCSAASVTDPMGPKVGLTFNTSILVYTNNLTDFTDGKANIYVDVGSATYNATTDTIVWTIGDINMGETHTMSYAVKIDDGVYGTNIPLNENTQLSYTDSGGSAATKTFPVPVGEIAKTDANYTVKHLFQNTSGTGYTEDTTLRESKSGKIGANTEAVAKSVTGFTAQSFSQKTITNDDATVVEIYYNRNSYSYTINHKEKGTTNVLDTVSGTALYGSTVTVSKKTITHYTYDSMDVSSIVIDTVGNVANVLYVRNPHTITYNVSGDNPSADKVSNYAYGDTITDYAPTQKNYDFYGWFTDSGCTTAWTKPDTMPDNDIVVYGKFVRKIASLTITKKGMQANENAIFLVTGEGLGSGLLVAVNGNNGTATISGLYIGATYTVTEQSSWSWKYKPTTAQSISVTEDETQYSVSFTNISEDSYWLSGESRKTNVFGLATD